MTDLPRKGVLDLDFDEIRALRILIGEVAWRDAKTLAPTKLREPQQEYLRNFNLDEDGLRALQALDKALAGVGVEAWAVVEAEARGQTMTKVNADLPEGCMQPARTILEHALAELRRALVMTGGSVDLRFQKGQHVYEQVHVTIGPPNECQWMAHKGFSVDTRRSLDAFELAKIALTIVPDRLVEKVRCDTCGSSGESAIVVMSRGRYCSKCFEKWRKSPITAAEMVELLDSVVEKTQ
jgi:hypothetical protein